MFIVDIIEDMIDDVEIPELLLIAGDVSFDYEISKIFYYELSQRWNPEFIIVVLGNHELWDGDCLGMAENNIDEVVEKYKELANQIGFTLLMNELCYSSGGGYTVEQSFLNEKEMLDLPDSDIIELFKDLPYAILGGLGFSGYAGEFNATSGLYRSTIKTLEEDLAETQKFERIYDRLNSLVGDRKIIVLTHTPKENWSLKKYNKNWIYVNGHTHRNTYFMDSEKTLYADNQVGYDRLSMGLRNFYISNDYDIFQGFEDGHYEITRKEYLNFNCGKRINVNFSETSGQIHMLKRSGLYCFVYEVNNKKYMLEGGRKRLLDNDITYYYDNMVKYADNISLVFGAYNKALEQLSRQIKIIGGSGEIHGSIVDIDHYNHVYLNANDGSLTAYSATSVVDKIVYPSLAIMLETELPELYENYLLVKKEDKKILTVNSSSLVKGVKYVSDTLMYKQSNVIKALQYTQNCNVIRRWSDALLDL